MARNKKKPEVLLQEGQLLGNGKYRIVKCLASSDYSITYEGVVTAFKTRVIIKELFYKELNGRDFGSPFIKVNGDEQDKALFAHQKKIFINEARRMSSVRNDHLVPIQDAFEDNGTAYQVVNYLDGLTLEELLEKNGAPLGEAQAAEILRQCLTALQSLHNFGLLHLDIKPGNVFITNDNQAKLINFGVWRMMPNIDTALKLPSGYTLRYSPDEVIEKKQDRWGAYTDIYSLGATTYAMLSGKIPPKAGDIMEEGDNAFEFPTSVRQAMRGLVFWMMTPRRKSRPQSVAAVLKKLNEMPPIEQSQPEPAPEPAPEPKPEPAPEPAPVQTPTYNPPVSQPAYTPTPSQPVYNTPQPGYAPIPSQTITGPGLVSSAETNANAQFYNELDRDTQILAPQMAPMASAPEAYGEQEYEYDTPKKSKLPLILIIVGAAVLTSLIGLGMYIWFGDADNPAVDDFEQFDNVETNFSLNNGLTESNGINANAFEIYSVNRIVFYVEKQTGGMMLVKATFNITRSGATVSRTNGGVRLLIKGNNNDNSDVAIELRPDSQTEVSYSDALFKYSGFHTTWTFVGSVPRLDLEKINHRSTTNILVMD